MKMAFPRMARSVCFVSFVAGFVPLAIAQTNAVPPAGSISTLTATLIKLGGVDPAKFDAAAKAEGLTKSQDLVGYVDGLQRQATGKVQFVAWALDKTRKGEPVDVVLFASGKMLVNVQARGARDDVAKSLGLSAELGRNVAVNTTLGQNYSCQELKNPLAIAVDTNKKYAVLMTNIRVNGC